MGKHEYENVMQIIKYEFEDSSTLTEKLAVLEYIMEAVRQDLQSSLITTVLYSGNHMEKEIFDPVPLYYKDALGNVCSIKTDAVKRIDLTKDSLLILPYCHLKMIKAVKTVLMYGYKYIKTNVMAEYYDGMGITYVYNGLHHTSAAAVDRQGYIEASCYDIAILFDHIYTDGENWYNKHTKEKIEPCADFRVAIIFSLAEIKHNLIGNEPLPEFFNKKSDTSESTVTDDETDVMLERLEYLSNENYYLKKENELLQKKIEKMKN